MFTGLIFNITPDCKDCPKCGEEIEWRVGCEFCGAVFNLVNEVKE